MRKKAVGKVEVGLKDLGKLETPHNLKEKIENKIKSMNVRNGDIVQSIRETFDRNSILEIFNMSRGQSSSIYSKPKTRGDYGYGYDSKPMGRGDCLYDAKPMGRGDCLYESKPMSRC